MATVHIGSISAGTLRTEDLLEAFASELDHLNGQRSELTDAAYRWINWLDDGQPANGLQDESEYCLEELFDALNEYAPILCYFGSHPGDGADYGFWPDVDALEEEMRYAEDTDDDNTKYLPDTNVLVQVSDHGNILVMDMDRRELWSCV
jgi:hypothetical protein